MNVWAETVVAVDLVKQLQHGFDGNWCNNWKDVTDESAEYRCVVVPVSADRGRVRLGDHRRPCDNHCPHDAQENRDERPQSLEC